MLDIGKDIQSLTTFRRQNAEAYPRLLDIAARADAEEGIRQGLDDVAHGRIRPVRDVFDEIRRKHGILR